MFTGFRTFVQVGIVMALAGAAAAPQGVVMQRNLSLPMAKSIAEGALAECKSKGFNTAVAVVDRSGQIMVILRDEQATAQDGCAGRERGQPRHTQQARREIGPRCSKPRVQGKARRDEQRQRQEPQQHVRRIERQHLGIGQMRTSSELIGIPQWKRALVQRAVIHYFPTHRDTREGPGVRCALDVVG